MGDEEEGTGTGLAYLYVCPVVVECLNEKYSGNTVLLHMLTYGTKLHQMLHSIKSLKPEHLISVVKVL